MKKQKHRSEQNTWRIRKNEKTYMMDGISLEKEQPEKEKFDHTKNGGGNMGKIYLEGADNTRDLGG